jgi:putative Mg2+ transporter-C (MgtC) family protein
MTAASAAVMDIDATDIFHIPDVTQMTRVVVRICLAALLGGLLGIERQRAGKAAGLRTHMLVALGAASFALFPVEAGMSISDLSRVIQGVAAGVGFLGAGTILKQASEERIQGLTTAANIWLTAAIGLAVGAGQLWIPTVCTVSALIVMAVLGRFERPAHQA